MNIIDAKCAVIAQRELVARHLKNGHDVIGVHISVLIEHDVQRVGSRGRNFLNRNVPLPACTCILKIKVQ